MGLLTMTEYEHAKLLANRVLDRTRADPDDDLAVLARQFQRSEERADKYKDQVCATADRAEKVEAALADLIEAWRNRGETTSLHTWNQRMKAAVAAAEQLPNVKYRLEHGRVSERVQRALSDGAPRT